MIPKRIQIGISSRGVGPGIQASGMPNGTKAYCKRCKKWTTLESWHLGNLWRQEKDGCYRFSCKICATSLEDNNGKRIDYYEDVIKHHNLEWPA